MYSSIVVDIASSSVDQEYEYFVPSDIAPYIQIGCRVKVEFGNTNKPILGIVTNLYDNKKFAGETRKIIELLDITPIISEKMFNIAYYLKETCICPLIRILDLMIPESLRLKSLKYLKLTNSSIIDPNLLEIFNNSQVVLYDSKLNGYNNKIKKAIKDGAIEVVYDAVSKVTYKYEKKYYVDLDVLNSDGPFIRSNNREFLEEFSHDEKLTALEILERYGVSLARVNSLKKMGFLKEVKLKVSRIKSKDLNNSLFSDYKESEFIEKFKSLDKPYYYIPSSKKELGETLVSLTKKTIESNKNVVILCGDILSTYKYYNIIKQSLGIEAACINSTLSSGEYFDYYNEIRNNNYQVIVTTAKGAFMPYSNVGLYMMIDADSDNYFNDQSPRYDLKKVFNYLSYLDKAMFIMTSFTPMINEYLLSLNSDIILINNLDLKKDIDTICIDLKPELIKGNQTYLSETLVNALNKTKKHNGKSVLIINNKSFANYVTCKNCGHVEKCPKCDLSLNYNANKKSLICPHCGYSKGFINSCDCGNPDLFFGGVGAQSIFDNLTYNYQFKCLCILDNSNFNDYLLNLSVIEDENCDIIITTETIARGLPLNNVETVGIINFDSTLNAPLVDANIKAFNLLITGGNLLSNKGKLYIQSFDISNKIIEYFITNDFNGLLKSEINSRNLTHNMPFYQVNRLIIKGKGEDLFKVAYTIKKSLTSFLGYQAFVMGPTYSKLHQGLILIVKHNDNRINEIYKKIYQLYANSGIMVIFDNFPRNL